MCKKFGEAESLFQRSLNVHRRVLGEHHPETTKMKIGYFWQLVDMKKIDRYRNMIPEMLSTYKQYSKQPYTDEVELYNYAYLLLWCLQKHMLTTERKVQKTDGTDRSLMAKLAESLLNKALKRYYRTLGEEHPRTLANMNLLANVYFIQRRLAEAEKLYRKIFWHQRRTLGEEHPDTLKSLANLGITFLFRGKRSQAETVLRKVQATQCRILGDDHPDLVKVKLYLSLVLRRQGRLACAKSILRGALEIQKRTLGANHPETLMIDYNLTELTRILDKTKRISVPGGRIDKLIR